MCANFQLGWCIWSKVYVLATTNQRQQVKSLPRKVIESDSSYLGPPRLMARGE